MIDRATVDRIFTAADIVEVVSDFVTLKKKGVNYSACCPFHNEKTPSFVVSPSKGLYKCFGCGKGGNAVNFVMEHEKLTYPEALKWVARKYGIEVQEKELTEQEAQANNDRESMLVVNSFAADYFVEQLSTPAGENIALGYFRERGFSELTIAKFKLGYCPEGGDVFSRAALKAGYKEEFLEKTGLTVVREQGGYYDRFGGRVIFPIHSLSGRVIGFGGRTLRTDKKTAKYVNSIESEVYHKSQSLYGLYYAKKAITQMDRCILVEGYTDVIQMFQSGIENVVASSGTALTEEQIKLIRRFTHNITVIYDGDPAGIKASMRGIDMILAQGMTVRVVMLPEGDDPDSFARKHNTTELQRFIAENEEDFISFKTRTLLADAKEDPIRRAELISDIIASIAVIPDPITRSVYIRECSRLMQVDEQLLNGEVARKRLSKVDGELWYETISNARRKEQFVARTEAPPAEGGATPNPAEAELDILEREIVGYLIKYGTENFDLELPPGERESMGVAETIVAELDMDGITLNNRVCQKVLEEYREGLKNENAPQADHFTNHADPAVAALATEILFDDEKYRISSLWERFDIAIPSERQRLGEAIPKALNYYKLKVIGKMIWELRNELAEAEVADTAEAAKMSESSEAEDTGARELDEGVFEKFRRIGELNELRLKISEKYSRTT